MVVKMKKFLPMMLLAIASALYAQEFKDAAPADDTVSAEPRQITPASSVKVAKSSPFEVNAGLGASISAAGNPSQVSDKLAMKEGYLQSVTEKTGLPFGVTGFANFGYRFSEHHKAGFEIAMGYSTDGGTARVTMGNKFPAYALDGSPMDVDGFLGNTVLNQMRKMYPGLSTKNTMRGHFIDPKLRAFYRYDSDQIWSIQAGIGAGVIIPFAYYAYPSRNPKDYYHTDPNNTDWINGLLGMGVLSSQGAFVPTAVPFPLVLTDGTTMMRAIQPVMDFNIRIGLGSLFYFEGTYSTEFQYIHNVKLILGIQGKGINS
jgi:hypothetical protein